MFHSKERKKWEASQKHSNLTQTWKEKRPTSQKHSNLIPTWKEKRPIEPVWFNAGWTKPATNKTDAILDFF